MKNAMIKGIIFDIRGVLVRDVDLFVYDEICKAFSVSTETAKREIKEPLKRLETGEITTKDFLEQYAKRLGKPSPSNQKLLTEPFERNFSIDNKVLEIILELKRKGYLLAALTNTHKYDVEVYKRHNLYSYFDRAVLSCEVGLAKPDKRIYELCLESMGLPPEQCVFIDDSRGNLKPAEELSMKTILYQNPSQLRNALSSLQIKLN